jgi:hypothetical protein
LPEDWSLPGHCPAQEARWPAEGKSDMSTPISARMFCAVRVSIPSTERSNSPRVGAAISRCVRANALGLLVVAAKQRPSPRRQQLAGAAGAPTDSGGSAAAEGDAGRGAGSDVLGAQER